MLHNFCEVATDFPAHMRQLKDPLKLRASEVVVQFPFIPAVTEEKTEEEISRIAEKRKEQGRKLQEMAAKTREEKACCVLFNLFTIRLISFNFKHSFCKKKSSYNASWTSKQLKLI